MTKREQIMQAAFTVEMRPYINANEQDIKAANEQFMNGEFGLPELHQKHIALNASIDKVADRMRNRIFARYTTQPNRACTPRHIPI